MISDNPYTYTTLDNGMRAVHIASHSNIDFSGVMINTGSRMDPSGFPGLAHFVEHTIFKGTRHRKAWHINGRMEAVGGELNAFTSKEETFIYTVSPGGNLKRAVELVADLIADPTFPEKEINIERAVVMDEIDSYLDSPADAIYDEFEDDVFANSPLGHNILGTRESVERITGNDCRGFVERWYTPARMVAFYSGSMPPARVFATMNRYFGKLDRPESTIAIPPTVIQNFDLTRQCEGSHQDNVVTGTAIGGITDPHRHAMSLLCNIVGGPGMNSLLNMEMRERRGLVYSVDASISRYTDCGLFTVSFGCDHSDTRECRRLVNRILGYTLPRQLNDRSVERAKRQFLGQVAVSNDNRENATFRVARSTCFFGQAIPDDDFARIINEITTEELQWLATTVLAPQGFSTLTYE